MNNFIYFLPLQVLEEYKKRAAAVRDSKLANTVTAKSSKAPEPAVIATLGQSIKPSERISNTVQ